MGRHRLPMPTRRTIDPPTVGITWVTLLGTCALFWLAVLVLLAFVV